MIFDDPHIDQIDPQEYDDHRHIEENKTIEYRTNVMESNVLPYTLRSNAPTILLS